MLNNDRVIKIKNKGWQNIILSKCPMNNIMITYIICIYNVDSTYTMHINPYIIPSIFNRYSSGC